MQQYLASNSAIDWKHSSILSKAELLASNLNSPTDIAKACFEFVRDNIEHCWDYQRETLTYSASDVLKHGTGYCYAKSHLLAALLRANKIPSGLCYQRLTIANNKPPFCIHGLNAVYLPDIGWYRIDPRGNTPDIHAQFSPPQEHLAFPIMTTGELDFPAIYAEPVAEITELLTQHSNVSATRNKLPDFTSLPKTSQKISIMNG